jgi:apolipoprotein D and lipocalin family protein
MGGKMKKIYAGALVVLLTTMLVKANKSDAPLRVVSNIDLSRYSGQWYEIARLPNRFEKKCVSDVTANYSLLKENRLRVVNRCRTNNGRFTEAKGVARLADKNGANSRLKVRFAPSFLSFLPFVWADYQVIELAPDYSYALVGEPGRKYLWILSRTPQMDEVSYRKLTDLAASQGFDVSRLVRTKHGAV